MGGNGSKGKKNKGGGGGGMNSTSENIHKAIEESSPGMKEFNTTKALDDAPVGTRIYDGSSTSTSSGSRPTMYEKTNKYGGWTLFGDKANYDETSSNKVAKNLVKKSSNPRFNLRVTK